ncbi:MAG: aminoacyl-tRNA hydrolase [Planctomycetota bacterium]|jgi:PTH1 family peptidyl-tRNA hydrolase|nr:aminoacyl-tRNA hydrolase [Planctomycetota bacterium]
MRVVVGLGNPGREYERTRHNIGWMALDSLAARIGATRFHREKSMQSAEGRQAGQRVYLLKPQTYMNRSGQALASWLGWFGEIREAIREQSAEAATNGPVCVWPGLMVVADDVNLPLGKLRFRSSGSAGGHNGLSDIAKALGGGGYPRLRLGIGLPPEVMDRTDYVLARFGADELPVVDKTAEVAAEALELWIGKGISSASDRYNGMAAGDGADAAEK